MRAFTLPVAFAIAIIVASTCVGQFYQQPNCPNGVCPLPTPAPLPFQVPVQSNGKSVEFRLELTPLAGDDKSIDVTKVPIMEASNDADRLEIVTRATVRVLVGNACGSGTVVGHDQAGNALILTNAHVAGTKRGKQCNVECWDVDGTSTRSTASIIASGYSRGLSVDFALLRAAPGFAADVVPVPLADRYPDGEHATNYGCPRCEWPSMQTIQFTDRESQILRWRPEAIGGRSGSSIVDYSGHGGSPVVVGLLTWGGGGEGLGQSSPFVIDAIRGKMPRSFEMLPKGITEVIGYVQEPSEDLIDLVTEDDDPPEDDEEGFRDRRRPGDPILERPIVDRPRPLLDGLRRLLLIGLAVAAAAAAAYYFFFLKR